MVSSRRAYVARHQVPLFDSYVITNAVQRRDFGGRDLTVCSSGRHVLECIACDSFVVMFVRQGMGECPRVSRL